jgi:DNA-binding NarL/FixJ family response regulator
MTHYVKVLIVDDQPRARQSLRALLSTWPPAIEIREAVDGNEAIRSVQDMQPDIVLMDVRMPEMDGLEATRLIKARWSQVKVIVLTLHGEYEAEALAAGADAFVGKTEPVDRLLATLLGVMVNRPHGRSVPEEVGDDRLVGS